MQVIITIAAILFGITLLLVIPALFSGKKPIEETRTDLDFTPMFHDMRIVPSDKEPIIRNTIPV